MDSATTGWAMEETWGESSGEAEGSLETTDQGVGGGEEAGGEEGEEEEEEAEGGEEVVVEDTVVIGTGGKLRRECENCERVTHADTYKFFTHVKTGGKKYTRTRAPYAHTHTKHSTTNDIFFLKPVVFYLRKSMTEAGKSGASKPSACRRAGTHS